MLHGSLVDQRWLHALMSANLEGKPLTPPARLLVPDGHLADLRYQGSKQAVKSGFGAGLSELGAVYVDADGDGLGLGVEGVFEWGKNAVVVLIDLDFGLNTGPAGLAGALSDKTGKTDSLLSNLSVSAPPVPGFGVDAALVVYNGWDLAIEELLDGTGLRGIHPPLGKPDQLAWLSAATNFGEGVRTATPIAPIPGEGFEALIPWRVLYPALAGKVPKGATIGISVVLVNDDGGYTSNQALPPFTDAENPGRAVTALPGVVRFKIDSNQDQRGDGDAPPF